jgi:signal transduction histidine kinase
LKWIGHYYIAAAIFLVCGSLGLTSFILLEKTPVSGTYFWFSALGLFGFFILGPRLGKVVFLLVGACQAAFILGLRWAPSLVPNGFTRQDFIEIFLWDVLGATATIFATAIFYERQRKLSQDELLKAEKNLLKQREATIHKTRLAELGQISSGVAHEINNPLTIINGYSRKLKDQFSETKSLTPEQLKMFESIERHCLRISKITRSLLSYARDAEHVDESNFSLAQLRDDALELCRERSEKRRISLYFAISSEQIRLQCSYVRLLQVLVNLLNNAIDAVSDMPTKWVDVSLQLCENRLLIRVTDSGPGIPAEIRDRIMQPFFTTKQDGAGTGLGLSLVDNIIRDLGGHFYLNTASPHTQFVVEVPAKREKPVYSKGQ